MPITNSSPDKGQPCLRPRSKGKKFERKSVIYNTAGNIIVQDYDPVLNVGSEVKNFTTAVNEVPFNGIKSVFKIYEKSDSRNALLFCVRHNVGN